MVGPPVVNNPWQSLRQFTAARIALGRTGASLPTQPQLAFQLAHAQARDAVHLPLDVAALLHDLQAAGVAGAANGLVLESAARDRLEYLQRPDLGRRLCNASRARLEAASGPSHERSFDIAFVLVDGLSALAVARHAAPLLARLQRTIAAENYMVAPLVIVTQGRVAVGDEVALLLGAKLVVVLIGERPGLSSPDSMGAYMTWMPAPGMTDAGRNCVSNIRPEGLGYEDAAHKISYLQAEMLRLQLSGVALKDESARAAAVAGPVRANFLLDSSG